jgi:hypothetical protein
MKLVRLLFSQRVTLTVGVYALLAKLLLAHDAPTATLAALFLALVTQLGHRALQYYGSIRDAVRTAVGTHEDQLAVANKAIAEHAAALTNAQKNIEILTKTVERKSVF